MSRDKIAFIGGGNMTRAIVGGLISSGVTPERLLIAEPSAEQRDRLGRDIPEVKTVSSNVEVATRVDCLVLAVKPQHIADVCREVRDAVRRSRPLIISIAAGVRSQDIDTWLGNGFAIVRVMPNQPALLRAGVSGMFANDRTSASQLAKASDIMAAVGSVVHVSCEADIDAVTAVSGSGPAYFLLLVDILASAAVKFGLEASQARLLAVETAKGSAALAAASGESMDVMIARVRSPGGTTAAALDALDNENIRDIFARALTAARDRAVELADQAGSTKQ